MKYEIIYSDDKQEALQRISQLQEQIKTVADTASTILDPQAEGSAALNVAGGCAWLGFYVAFYFIAAFQLLQLQI